MLPARPTARALALAALGLAAFAIAYPLVVVRAPPMTDLPFHAAQSAIFRHYADPSYGFREQFVLQPLAVPYVSMYGVAALAMLALPALAAVKLAAFVMLALLPAGLAVLFHGMRKSPLLGLSALGLVWCDLTHWGFLNHVGALGLFAMAAGLALLVVDRPSRRRQLGLALVLVALFFTHIFRVPFALLTVVGTAVLVWPATRRLRAVLLPLVPTVVLFVAWLELRPPTLGVHLPHMGLHLDRLSRLPEHLFNGFVDPAEGAAVSRWVATVLVVAAAGLTASALRGQSSRRRERLFRRGASLAALACVLGFLGLYLVLPLQIGLWWYVYPREATSAAFLALALLPDLPRSTWLRAPLVAALALSGLGLTAVVAKNYAAFDRQNDDFFQVIERIPRAPKLCYLVFDHRGATRAGTPYIHLPAYVQAMRGGWLSFHFAGWGASPVAFRRPDEPGAVVPPPTPDRWEWTPERFRVERDGAFFDWFLVRQRGAPDAIFARDPTIERVENAGMWWLYRRRARH